MEEEIVLMEENDIEEINIEEENYSGKPYVLPIATKETLGGIKVGKNLTIEEDGTLNAKESGGSGKSPLEIYSTEETLVGVYKNKPLYRKVLSFDTIESIPTGLTDLDSLVRMECMVRQTSGQWRSLPWLYTMNNALGDASWAGGFYYATSNYINFQVGSSLGAIDKGVVILEYTKTTDVEGVVVEPNEVVFVEETDPSVPEHVKAITQEDIEKWNNGTGSGEINIEGDITTNNNTRLKDRNYNVISISHRGYNTIAPENTLPAFILSKEKGYNYVECDVSFTSDGIPVLLHDETIDRTSNGSGRVSNLTYNQLLQYDFGNWKSSEYAGTKIPTFEEFIVLCKNIGLHPCIELKDNGNYTQEQILEIVDIVKNCGMKGNVTYVSFNINYLNYVKAYDKQARLGYVMFDITQDKINEALNLKSGLNDVFITASYTNLTDAKIQMCIDNSLPLEMWSVNDVDVIKNMNSYISGVTSDSLIASQILSSNYGINSEETGSGGSGGSGGLLEIETIVIKPNIEKNSDGGTIKDVGIIQKCGNECKLILTSSAGYIIPNGTYTVIGVIPEGYRPKEDFTFSVLARKTDYTTFGDFRVVVKTNGEISVMQRSGSNFKIGDLPGVVSYYIDEPLQLPGGSSSNVYSEEETVIGTWVDGKPLYRKAINVDVTSLTEAVNYITYDCSTIDRCTDLRAITERQYNIIETVPRIADSKNIDAWYSMIQLDKAGNRFIIGLGSSLIEMVKNGYWFYIIFEYTKTTD